MLRQAARTLLRAPGFIPNKSLGHLAQKRVFTSPAQDPRVMVIFGASGGIGSALSELLATTNPDANLIFAANEGNELKRLVESLGKGEAHEVDAQSPEQVDRIIDGAVTKYGRLDAVASMVGNVMMKPATGSIEEPSAPQGTTSLADLEAALRINLYTSFNILQSSAKAMQQNGGGSIVLTSAAVGEMGVPHFEAMGAAKAGVEGLARSFAATYVRHGVRINCVAPGLTRLHYHTQTATFMQAFKPKLAKAHPEPKDIAHALGFFMHPHTDFITGQCLAVDGGLTSITLQNRA